MARLVVVCRVCILKVKKFIGTIWKGTSMKGRKRCGKSGYNLQRTNQLTIDITDICHFVKDLTISLSLYFNYDQLNVLKKQWNYKYICKM
jgi:hypothetical protein